MHPPHFPRATWTPGNETAFNIEDSDDFLGLARELIDGDHPGVLTTVDRSGSPHCRWMATLSFDFPTLYAVTAPQSQKMTHLLRNPRVSWMFTNSDFSIVLNLLGKAEVVHDTSLLKKVWRSIEDKSRAYFLNNFAERPGIALLRTTIDHVVCTIPHSGLRWEMSADSFKPRGNS